MALIGFDDADPGQPDLAAIVETGEPLRGSNIFKHCFEDTAALAQQPHLTLAAFDLGENFGVHLDQNPVIGRRVEAGSQFANDISGGNPKGFSRDTATDVAREGVFQAR